LFAQAVAGRRTEYREGGNEELSAQGVLLTFEQGEKCFAFHGKPPVQILARFGEVVRGKVVFSGRWRRGPSTNISRMRECGADIRAFVVGHSWMVLFYGLITKTTC
jgi:hypothetical protein